MKLKNNLYNYDKTLAQMSDTERENIIKYKQIDLIIEFSKWYLLISKAVFKFS